jgi:hypothetical protein
MPQINARLPRKFRALFDQYSAEVGLDAAELARLLIVREMHVQRIVPRRRRKPVTNRSASTPYRKLTAHFHHAASIAGFDRYARSHGLSRANAAKLIFEHELKERWLLKAFSWVPRTRGAAS